MLVDSGCNQTSTYQCLIQGKASLNSKGPCSSAPGVNSNWRFLLRTVSGWEPEACLQSNKMKQWPNVVVLLHYFLLSLVWKSHWDLLFQAVHYNMLDGHLRLFKTLNQLMACFYWQDIHADVHRLLTGFSSKELGWTSSGLTLNCITQGQECQAQLYNRFVCNYSMITSLLIELSKKGAQIQPSEWTVVSSVVDHFNILLTPPKWSGAAREGWKW